MSTTERLRHTAHLTRQQREAIADRFAASGSNGSWGEYLANAAVDHAITQAHAERLAESLRNLRNECIAECRSEGVPTDEWENLNVAGAALAEYESSLKGQQEVGK